MTSGSAIKDFFDSFGIDAYPSTAVDSKATMPYLTYSAPINDITASSSSSWVVNLYYRSTSEAIPNAKVKEISDRLKNGGVLLKCDEGRIWIQKGEPFAQAVTDPSDLSIKRRYINLSVECLFV